MKYYAIADIHGFYSLATDALVHAGFDPDDKNATLILLGDIFDRGKEPVYCWNLARGLIPDKNGGLRKMANKPIMIMGNHEICFDDLVERGTPLSYDISNKTFDSVERIKLYAEQHSLDPEGVVNSIVKWHSTLPWYFELGDYIFAHSWIPLKGMTDDSDFITQDYDSFEVMDGWENASVAVWKRACWANPTECLSRHLIPNGKTIVFGHWHASAFHRIFEPSRELTDFYIPCDFSVYVGNHAIAIDACTAYTKQCNVAIFSDEGDIHLERTILWPELPYEKSTINSENRNNKFLKEE